MLFSYKFLTYRTLAEMQVFRFDSLSIIAFASLFYIIGKYFTWLSVKLTLFSYINIILFHQCLCLCLKDTLSFRHFCYNSLYSSGYDSWLCSNKRCTKSMHRNIFFIYISMYTCIKREIQVIPSTNIYYLHRGAVLLGFSHPNTDVFVTRPFLKYCTTHICNGFAQYLLDVLDRLQQRTVYIFPPKPLSSSSLCSQ